MTATAPYPDYAPESEDKAAFPWLALLAGVGIGVALLGGRKVGMQLTTAVAGDWFRQLKAEHRMAQGLFELGARTKDNETGKRTAILAHLAYALLKHGVQEETVVYPTLREYGRNKTAVDLADEHFDIKTYLHRLSEMAKDDPRWIRLWNEFHELVDHHIREEEEDVFPPMHAALTPKQNRHLTLAMNREGVKLA